MREPIVLPLKLAFYVRSYNKCLLVRFGFNYIEVSHGCDRKIQPRIIE